MIWYALAIDLWLVVLYSPLLVGFSAQHPGPHHLPIFSRRIQSNSLAEQDPESRLCAFTTSSTIITPSQVKPPDIFTPVFYSFVSIHGARSDLPPATSVLTPVCADLYHFALSFAVMHHSLFGHTFIQDFDPKDQIRHTVYVFPADL